MNPRGAFAPKKLWLSRKWLLCLQQQLIVEDPQGGRGRGGDDANWNWNSTHNHIFNQSYFNSLSCLAV